MRFERPEIKNKNILNRIKVGVIVKHEKMIHLLLFEQANKIWNRINKYLIVFYKMKLENRRRSTDLHLCSSFCRFVVQSQR